MALSEGELLLLAKRTLQLPTTAPASAVPKCYLKELRRHLNLYAEDTNFTIQLEPGIGFGVVRCLEEGCNFDISLVPRISTPDGGKKDGVGSLSAYRTHIANHSTHKQGRLRRLKVEQARMMGNTASMSAPVTSASTPSSKTTSSTPRKQGLLSVLDASFGSPAACPGGSISMPNTPSKKSSPSSLKMKPAEPTIPRKRISDSVFPMFDDSDDEKPLSSSSPASVKKQRFSSPPAALPLLASIAGPSSPRAPLDLYDIRAQISEVRTAILQLQPQIDRILRKKSKTKSDLTRLRTLQGRLDALIAKRDGLNASIPSAVRSPKKVSPAPIKSEMGGLAGLPGLPGNQVQMFQPSSSGSNMDIRFTQPSYTTGPAWQSYGSAVQSYNQSKPWKVTVPGPTQPVASSSKQAIMAIVKDEEKPFIFKRSDSPNPSVSSVARATPFSAIASSSNTVVKMDVDEKPKIPFDMHPTSTGSEEENIPPVWPNMLKGTVSGHRDDERFDQDGDFYGRGKDMFMGPIAKADDIDKFLVAAGNAEQFDGNASVAGALARLGLNNLFEPLPGMTIALMPHQAIGVSWMLGRERSIMQGGAMADEMGLGKTVQMMSVIVSNQSDDPMQRTTLIVAPLALLDQWQLELESKTDCGLTCLIYHGSNKPKRKSDLMAYDVVLTTFGTLAMEWPDPEAEEKKKKQKSKKKKEQFVVSDSDDSDEPSSKKSRKKSTKGLLLQINWWRIVLDEAQNIRNRRTRISRAVSKLDAKYRWCLTGTPIINGLSDAYPMFRFLAIRPWYDWTEFNSHIARYEKKNPSLATDRLQVIFKSMLIRRKKDSMLDGKRLIELPAKIIEMHKLVFTTDEREIYDMVEAKSRAVFNRFLRAGTVLKNYHQVLVMLLRLRQICSHPSLIYEQGGAFTDPGDVDDSFIQPGAKAELARAAGLISPDFVARMRFRFKQASLHRMQAEKESADADVDDECPVCLDAMVDPILTPCTHVFCRDCIQNVLNAPRVDDQNNDNDIRYKQDERPCPSCRSPISEEKIFSRLAFDPTDEELEKAQNPNNDFVDMDDVMKKTKKGEGKGKSRASKSNVRRMQYSSGAEEADADDVDNSEDEEEDEDDGDDMSDFIVQDDEDVDAEYVPRGQKKKLGKARAIVLDSDDEEDSEVLFGKKSVTPEPVRAPDGKVKLMSKFLPSTKMKHMMESLQQCAKEFPDEKTLVISQWTSCLDLVSNYLTENGILHVKYQGDMTRAKRDQAVRVFMAKDKAKVMLMSLKCGGVGLNLTRANRVISLDLGWSEAVEHQAFDRVHRLGQHRPVFVNRLVIENTVEDRILALQERKRHLAEGSLGEGAGKKIGRLSVRELATLFGVPSRG